MLKNCLEGFIGSRCDRDVCLPQHVCHFVEVAVWKNDWFAIL